MKSLTRALLFPQLLSVRVAAFLLVLILLSAMLPGEAKAVPSGGDCGVTWEYSYEIETNPFSPGTSEYDAWAALYGSSLTVETTYPVAATAEPGEECPGVPVTTPNASILVVPSSISSGGSSWIFWNSQYTTSCTGTNFSTGGATSGSTIVTLTSSKTYSITCTDGTDTASASATVTVGAAGAPTANLSASPSSINGGQSSTLSWSSSNATSCTGTNFSTGSATSGSASVSPSQSTSYLVSCSGTGSSASASATVTVVPPLLSVSCSASPSSLHAGQSTTWTAVPSGGTGSYTYSWSGTDGLTGTTASLSKLYTTSGTKTASVSVVSGSQSETTNCTNSAAVASASLSGTCSVSPSSVYAGTPVTWTAYPSGGATPYTYSWTGTDSLSGTSASVTKTYSTSGTKSASVVITGASGGSSVALEGGMQCSGGTRVGGTNDIQDGVGFGGGADAAFTAVCNEITPAGGCCNTEVREVVDANGTPVNTYYFYDSYSGATLIEKASYQGGINNYTNYNYAAGLATAASPQSVTGSCSNFAAVSAPLPDLTPSSPAPLTVAAGANVTLTITVSNSGSVAASTFGSTIYVCGSSDAVCLNDPFASSESFWQRIFTFLFPSVEASTSIKVPLTRRTVPANGNRSQNGSYSFPTPGSYQMRACVDTPLNEVSESNENNNCTSWETFTVNAGTLSASCSVSPSGGYTGDTFTWTAVPVSGTGSYTYSWSGTDGLSGSAISVSKSYSTGGTKSGTVTVTSGAQSRNATCTTGLLQLTPTTLVTVTPTVIVGGVTSPVIEWTSTNTTSCSSAQFSTGGATSGSATVSPAVTTTYSITCTNGTRSASSSVLVTVEPAGLTLEVSPGTTVRQGDTAVISWGVEGTPDSCLISGPGLSSTALSGSQGVVINQESTYTLTCIKDGESTSKSVTISIIPRFQEI